MNKSHASPRIVKSLCTLNAIGALRLVVIGLCVFVLVTLSACGGTPLPKFLTRPTPTPRCVEPTLTLSTTKFVIKTVARAADGSISVPPDTSGIAYQIEGTQWNPVFVLSPTPNNLALKSTVKDGDQATLILANCNTTVFSVSAPQPAPPNNSTLLNQPASGIVIFVQTSPAAEGFVVTGDLIEEILKAIDTPQPGSSNRQAEISLLETVTSADKATIRVGVSILNSGTAPFSLAASDVSLTPENAAPIAPTSAEPSLPHNIRPGATETIYFTFPRPSSSTAVIKVFDIEFDLENF